MNRLTRKYGDKFYINEETFLPLALNLTFVKAKVVCIKGIE